MLFFEWPWPVGTAVFVLAAVAMAFAPYGLLRRLFRNRISDDTQTLSSSLIVRLGSLHALILALVFAQEQVNYVKVRQTIAEEVSAIADVYYDLKRYRGKETLEIRKAVANYVQTVFDEEWPLLKRGTLSDKAWEHYVQVDTMIYALSDSTTADKDVREGALRDWDEVSSYRRTRERAATDEVPGFFWIVAILGFIFVTLPYFSFKPSPANLFGLAAFAAYNGIVLYFIVGIGNPFAGPAPLSPDAFERLFSEDMVNLLRQVSSS